MNRLLYVDDETALLDIGKLFLEKGGEFTVDISPSAQEALEKIRTSCFDAIISDYQMPGIDGIKFLQIIREKYGNLPFILFTGRGREEVLIEAINNGVDFYLQKGGDPKSQFAELSHKVKRAIERKKVLESIRASEEKYRELVENANTIILKTDKEGKITFFNEYAQHFFGYTSEEILGRNITGTIVPLKESGSGRDLVQLIDNIVLDPEKYTYNENENIKKNGERVWIKWWNKSLLNTDEKITGMICIGTDITDERKANTALRESEEKFRMLVEQSFEGILILDSAGKVLFCNNVALKIIGTYTIEDIIGTTIFLRIIVPSSRDDFIHYFNQILNGTEAYVSRYHTYNLKHEEKWIECLGKLITFKNAPVILISIRDITLQYHAENSLRESKEKFSTLFQNNPLALSLVSAHTGTYVDINNTFQKCSGYSRNEIIGKTAHDLQIFVNLNEYEHFKSNLNKHGYVDGLEMKCRNKSGMITTCLFHSNFLYMNGKPYILTSFKDITEQKELNATHQMLVRSMVGTTGLNALKEVSDAIISWIHADSIIIGEILPDKETIKVLYMLLDKKEIHDFSYSIKGTPSETVIKNGYCIFSDNVTGLFPEDKGIKDFYIRGYVGTPLKNTKGEIIGILSILSKSPIMPLSALKETLDIIAVKVSVEVECIQMNRILLEKHQQLDNALDIAHMAIWEYDRRSDFFTFNDRFYSLYGTTAEIEGGYLIKSEEYANRFLHPSDSHLVREEIEMALLTHDPDYYSEVEHRIIRRDGEIRSIIVRYTVKLDSSGNVVMTQGANQDITDRKKIESTFLETNKKLNLLTNITHHDIRNKLTVLEGYLDLLKTEINSPDTAQNYIQIITDNVEIIRNQIEFTRIYQDLRKQQPVWQNIGDAVRQTLKELDLSFISLSLLNLDNILVYADPMLPKVFFNLIDNALHYGGPNLTKVLVSANITGDQLILTCEDDGNGIINSEKKKIFIRGYGKNSGLGLFLIREILGISGMTIQETGNPVNGACFEITVPKGVWKNIP